MVEPEEPCDNSQVGKGEGIVDCSKDQSKPAESCCGGESVLAHEDEPSHGDRGVNFCGTSGAVRGAGMDAVAVGRTAVVEVVVPGSDYRSADGGAG